MWPCSGSYRGRYTLLLLCSKWLDRHPNRHPQRPNPYIPLHAPHMKLHGGLLHCSPTSNRVSPTHSPTCIRSTLPHIFAPHHSLARYYSTFFLLTQHWPIPLRIAVNSLVVDPYVQVGRPIKNVHTTLHWT